MSNTGGANPQTPAKTTDIAQSNQQSILLFKQRQQSAE